LFGATTPTFSARTAAVGTCRAVGLALLQQGHDDSSDAVVTLDPALSSFTTTMPTGIAAPPDCPRPSGARSTTRFLPVLRGDPS
jgi:hypothetical protein